MTDELPRLPHGCNSWIVTSPSGQVFELYDSSNARKAIKAMRDGWKVQTAVDYLHWINEEIRSEQ
jgi:hypothetical protein